LFVYLEKHYIFSLFNLSSACISLFNLSFFHIPSFLLHILVTVKNAHRKTQPISSQSSHKKHIFSCTFGSFLREIKIPKQDPTSPYPVSPSPDPAQREWHKQEGKLSGERGMRTGDEEQISDRRERTEREKENRGMVMVSCPLNLWWCPASSKNRGMLERTEREQGKRDNRERTISDRRERTNSETRKPRGMRGMGGF